MQVPTDRGRAWVHAPHRATFEGDPSLWFWKRRTGRGMMTRKAWTISFPVSPALLLHDDSGSSVCQPPLQACGAEAGNAAAKRPGTVGFPPAGPCARTQQMKRKRRVRAWWRFPFRSRRYFGHHSSDGRSGFALHARPCAAWRAECPVGRAWENLKGRGCRLLFSTAQRRAADRGD